MTRSSIICVHTNKIMGYTFKIWFVMWKELSINYPLYTAFWKFYSGVKILNALSILLQAFGAFDKDHTSRISVQDFRRVLDLFCFKMTDSQWKSVLSKLQMIGDRVNYSMFLDSYTMTEQEVGGGCRNTFIKLYQCV